MDKYKLLNEYFMSGLTPQKEKLFFYIYIFFNSLTSRQWLLAHDQDFGRILLYEDHLCIYKKKLLLFFIIFLVHLAPRWCNRAICIHWAIGKFFLISRFQNLKEKESFYLYIIFQL